MLLRADFAIGSRNAEEIQRIHLQDQALGTSAQGSVLSHGSRLWCPLHRPRNRQNESDDGSYCKQRVEAWNYCGTTKRLCSLGTLVQDRHIHMPKFHPQRAFPVYPEKGSAVEYTRSTRIQGDPGGAHDNHCEL